MSKKRICGIAKVTHVSEIFDAGKKAEIKMRTDGKNIRIELDIDSADMSEFLDGDQFLVLIAPYESLFDGVAPCVVVCEDKE